MKKNILGVDIAKQELVIFFNDKFYHIANQKKSISAWFNKHTSDMKGLFVVFEPTGGYEKCLASYLRANDFDYRMVHANHVRAFAKALGLLAKTDTIDAKVIADYAKAVQLKPSKASNRHATLKALLNRRDQLVALRIEENNRLETLDCKEVVKLIKQHIKYIEKQIVNVEKQLKDYVNSEADVKQSVDLYTSIPGVGLLTSLRIISDLPEIFDCNEKQVAAITGLAPMNKDSGATRGRRYIAGGRPKIRRALYMASISAIKCNPMIKAFYQRLKSKGKPSKVAIIACARKLLLAISSVAIRQTPWVSNTNIAL